MKDNETIRLAGKEYAVTLPLTIGQAEDVEIVLSEESLPGRTEETRRLQDQNRKILAIVLREHEGITAESLREMRIPKREMIAAVRQALELAGFELADGKAAGEKKPGEEKAEARAA